MRIIAFPHKILNCGHNYQWQEELNGICMSIYMSGVFARVNGGVGSMPSAIDPHCGGGAHFPPSTGRGPGKGPRKEPTTYTHATFLKRKGAGTGERIGVVYPRISLTRSAHTRWVKDCV